MRMASSATGQVVRSVLAEGVNERACVATGVALDPEVLGLEGCSALEEPERALAVRAAVDEPVPGEVVKVTVATSEEESGRHGVGVLALVAVRV